MSVHATGFANPATSKSGTLVAFAPCMFTQSTVTATAAGRSSVAPRATNGLSTAPATPSNVNANAASGIATEPVKPSPNFGSFAATALTVPVPAVTVASRRSLQPSGSTPVHLPIR